MMKKLGDPDLSRDIHRLCLLVGIDGPSRACELFFFLSFLRYTFYSHD